MEAHAKSNAHTRSDGQSAGHASASTSFHGLIQHSFALRLYKEHEPFEGDDTEARIAKRFELPEANGGGRFQVAAVGTEPDEKSKRVLAQHGVLVHESVTTVARKGIPLIERDAQGDYREDIPKALSWAASPGSEESWQKFIFAHRDHRDKVHANDFLVEEVVPGGDEDAALAISRALAELFAHRRSLLFGIDLANNFVNVMLPHAVLKPAGPPLVCHGPCGAKRDREECPRGPLLLQPLVSLRRAPRAEAVFRRMYSLTLLLIPLEQSARQADKGRRMSVCEINALVNAGWGLASAPSFEEVGLYDVSGPLTSYVTRLDPSAVGRLRATMEGEEGADEGPACKFPPITLRQASETLMFAVALRLVCGAAGRQMSSATTAQTAGGAGAPNATQQGSGTTASPLERRIGDGVITSLGNSRVSAVMVVDGKFKKSLLDNRSGDAFPGSLHKLMKVTSAPETRIADRRRFRLDLPFFDRDVYAIGTLPASSCLVATFDRDEQRGRYDSALTHAAWLGYMTIGAATAIGTIRSIHRELERTNLAKPAAVADIEREVVFDLNEIYDLDITWDAYRHRYRRLRGQLGITSDYEALESKLQALYRQTTAHFEAESQEKLASLTRWIVVASVLLVALALAALVTGLAIGD